jgi:hypothetical protein
MYLVIVIYSYLLQYISLFLSLICIQTLLLLSAECVITPTT